jgi:hypothetical protein
MLDFFKDTLLSIVISLPILITLFLWRKFKESDSAEQPAISPFLIFVFLSPSIITLCWDSCKWAYLPFFIPLLGPLSIGDPMVILQFVPKVTLFMFGLIYIKTFEKIRTQKICWVILIALSCLINLCIYNYYNPSEVQARTIKERESAGIILNNNRKSIYLGMTKNELLSLLKKNDLNVKITSGEYTESGSYFDVHNAEAVTVTNGDPDGRFGYMEFIFETKNNTLILHNVGYYSPDRNRPESLNKEIDNFRAREAEYIKKTLPECTATSALENITCYGEMANIKFKSLIKDGKIVLGMHKDQTLKILDDEYLVYKNLDYGGTYNEHEIIYSSNGRKFILRNSVVLKIEKLGKDNNQSSRYSSKVVFDKEKQIIISYHYAGPIEKISLDTDSESNLNTQSNFLENTVPICVEPRITEDSLAVTCIEYIKE